MPVDGRLLFARHDRGELLVPGAGPLTILAALVQVLLDGGAALAEGAHLLLTDVGQLEAPIHVGQPHAVAQLLHLARQLGAVERAQQHLVPIHRLVVQGPPLSVGALGRVDEDAVRVQLRVAGPAQVMLEARRQEVAGCRRRGLSRFGDPAGRKRLRIRQCPIHRVLMRLDQAHVPTHQGLQGDRLRRAEGGIGSAAAPRRRVMQLLAAGQPAVQ